MAGSGQTDVGSINVVIYRDTKTGDTVGSAYLRQRLLCQVLLAELPDPVISEALDSLSDLWYTYEAGLLPAVAVAPPRISRGRVIASRPADPILIAEG